MSYLIDYKKNELWLFAIINNMYSLEYFFFSHPLEYIFHLMGMALYVHMYYICIHKIKSELIIYFVMNYNGNFSSSFPHLIYDFLQINLSFCICTVCVRVCVCMIFFHVFLIHQQRNHPQHYSFSHKSSNWSSVLDEKNPF